MANHPHRKQNAPLVEPTITVQGGYQIVPRSGEYVVVSGYPAGREIGTFKSMRAAKERVDWLGSSR